MAEARRPESLTPRQREVLNLIARGLTNAQIADRLGISLDGAKWHVGEVIGRLGVSSREEAALLWRLERRPGRRLKRLLATVRMKRATVIATVGSAAAGLAIVAGFLVTTGGGREAPPYLDSIAMPSLPADLASPTAPMLVYVDAAFTEAPAPQQIVVVDLAKGEEVRRTTLDGVNEVAQLGTSLVGVRENALLQFDFRGEAVRTIHSAESIRGFALSDDKMRAVIFGDDAVSIISLGTGEEVARLPTSELPGWAEGARFSWTSWIPGAETAIVALVRQSNGPPSWPGYVLLGADRKSVAHQALGRLSLSKDGTMLLALPADLCVTEEAPRVLDTASADEVRALPAADGFLLDVFWSVRGTLISRVAEDIEAEGPCGELPGSQVRWEEFDLATGSATKIDDVGALVSELTRSSTGGIVPACGPDEPLRWNNGGPDCPEALGSFGFYYEGVPLNAINPRFVLGFYNP